MFLLSNFGRAFKSSSESVRDLSVKKIVLLWKWLNQKTLIWAASYLSCYSPVPSYFLLCFLKNFQFPFQSSLLAFWSNRVNLFSSPIWEHWLIFNLCSLCVVWEVSSWSHFSHLLWVWELEGVGFRTNPAWFMQPLLVRYPVRCEKKISNYI